MMEAILDHSTLLHANTVYRYMLQKVQLKNFSRLRFGVN